MPATSYRRGVLGILGKSLTSRETQSGANVPVYIGRLPVHLAAEGYKDKVNVPMLIRNWRDVEQKAGYSDDWENWDLCEAFDAHFRNEIDPVGPIVVVNVFDPDIMASADTEIVTKPWTGKRVTFEDDLCLPDTIHITGLEPGKDFTVSHNPDAGLFTILDVKGTLTGDADIQYFRAQPDDVTPADVIGGSDSDGNATGVRVVEKVYQQLNVIPAILCSPGFGHIKTVRDALINASSQIGGHWYAYVNTDIPSDTVKTIDEAIAWKKENGYSAGNESACWPMAYKVKKRYHISTLTTVAMMQKDIENGGLPYASPSNNPVDVTGCCLKDGTSRLYGEPQANRLNEYGIKTLFKWAGSWDLWGPHNSAFVFGERIDERDRFDSGRRMLIYLLNDFQVRHKKDIDDPMTQNRIQTILTNYRERLDGFVASGALLYADVAFLRDSNDDEDLASGSIQFDIKCTTAPALLSITAKVSYTDQGLALLFPKEE